MADDLQTLQRALTAEGPKPIYIVKGAERLLVDEAVRMILTAAVGDASDSMAVTRVDLGDPGRSARDVLAACRSMGLFATRSAVLVRSAELIDRNAETKKELAAYASEPNREATLILVATKLDGKSALVKRVKKSGKVLTFDALRQRDTPPWITQEARSLGHRVDAGAARLIADLVGPNLAQLRLVVDQLSLFVGPDRPITEGDVTHVLAATRAHGIFELVDAVGQRRANIALIHLDSMLAHREPALRILAMLIRHFRLLWQTHAAKAQRTPLDGVQRALGIHPFQAKKLYAQADQFDDRTLAMAWERLAAADLALKSKGLPAKIVMERLVLDLCGGAVQQHQRRR